MCLPVTQPSLWMQGVDTAMFASSPPASESGWCLTSLVGCQRWGWCPAFCRSHYW